MEVDTSATDAKENSEVAANTDGNQQALAPQSAAKRMKLEPKASTPAAPKPAMSRWASLDYSDGC